MSHCAAPEQELCQAVKDGDNASVERALSLGADPNLQTKDWNKTRPIILAAAAGHLDIIKTLLSQPHLDPNLTDELFGNTALIDASYAGNTEVVEELVKDNRTEVNFRTERSGLTALMQVRDDSYPNIVSQNNHFESIELKLIIFYCFHPHHS